MPRAVGAPPTSRSPAVEGEASGRPPAFRPSAAEWRRSLPRGLMYHARMYGPARKFYDVLRLPDDVPPGRA